MKENNLENLIRKEPVQLDIVEKSNEDILHNKKTEKKNKKETFQTFDDFPETTINKLSVDNFPDLNKEKGNQN